MFFLPIKAGDRIFALPVDSVELLTWRTEVLPVPGMNDSRLLGVVDVHGYVMPVVSLRSLTGLEEKYESLVDLLIVIADRDRKIAVLVEGAETVSDVPETDLFNLSPSIAGFSEHGFRTEGGEVAMVLKSSALLDLIERLPDPIDIAALEKGL